MVSRASVLARPRGLDWPWQVLAAWAVGLVAVLILVLAQRVEARLAVYGAKGTAEAARV